MIELRAASAGSALARVRAGGLVGQKRLVGKRLVGKRLAKTA